MKRSSCTRTGNRSDATVAAADKAIAADPTKPIPYYLKGQALIGKATVDPKTGKDRMRLQDASRHTRNTWNSPPTGRWPPKSKAVLEGMGQTVKSTYKAKK